MVVDSITEVLVSCVGPGTPRIGSMKTHEKVQVQGLTAAIRHQASGHILHLVGHASHLDTPLSVARH